MASRETSASSRTRTARSLATVPLASSSVRSSSAIVSLSNTRTRGQGKRRGEKRGRAEIGQKRELDLLSRFGQASVRQSRRRVRVQRMEPRSKRRLLSRRSSRTRGSRYVVRFFFFNYSFGDCVDGAVDCRGEGRRREARIKARSAFGWSIYSSLRSSRNLRDTRARSEALLELSRWLDVEKQLFRSPTRTDDSCYQFGLDPPRPFSEPQLTVD
jgi:hypothetical protein